MMWLVAGTAAWTVLSVPVGLLLGQAVRIADEREGRRA